MTTADADYVVQGEGANSKLQRVSLARDAVGNAWLLFSQAGNPDQAGLLRASPSVLDRPNVLNAASGVIRSQSSEGFPFENVVPGRTTVDGADDVVTGQAWPGLWSLDDIDGTVYESEAPIPLSAGGDDWLTTSQAIGDVDGDGRADLMLTQEDWPAGAERGRVALLLAANLPLVGPVDFGSLALVAEGAADNASFGYRALRAGDFDGDERDDLLVTAYGTGFHGPLSGSVYVLPTPE